jgi:hypothetical protein
MTTMVWYQDAELVDRLGRGIADILLVLLALFFLYGYLGWLVFG